MGTQDVSSDGGSLEVASITECVSCLNCGKAICEGNRAFYAEDKGHYCECCAFNVCSSEKEEREA